MTCTNKRTPAKRTRVAPIRSLASVAQAVHDQGLETLTTSMPEVVFQCPRCKKDRRKQLCSITIVDDHPIVRCNGCERWGDDPFDILTILGYDPDTTDEFEVALRVFDLLWALERAS